MKVYLFLLPNKNNISFPLYEYGSDIYWLEDGMLNLLWSYEDKAEADNLRNKALELKQHSFNFYMERCKDDGLHQIPYIKVLKEVQSGEQQRQRDQV